MDLNFGNVNISKHVLDEFERCFAKFHRKLFHGISPWLYEAPLDEQYLVHVMKSSWANTLKFGGY